MSKLWNIFLNWIDRMTRGEVVITTTLSGECVAVTRQNNEGQKTLIGQAKSGWKMVIL